MALLIWGHFNKGKFYPVSLATHRRRLASAFAPLVSGKQNSWNAFDSTLDKPLTTPSLLTSNPDLLWLPCHAISRHRDRYFSIFVERYFGNMAFLLCPMQSKTPKQGNGFVQCSKKRRNKEMKMLNPDTSRFQRKKTKKQKTSLLDEVK